MNTFNEAVKNDMPPPLNVPAADVGMTNLGKQNSENCNEDMSIKLGHFEENIASNAATEQFDSCQGKSPNDIFKETIDDFANGWTLLTNEWYNNLKVLEEKDKTILSRLQDLESNSKMFHNMYHQELDTLYTSVKKILACVPEEYNIPPSV